MKKRIIVKITILIMLIYINVASQNSTVLAQEMIHVTANREVAKVGEQIEIITKVDNVSVVSLTLQIYFDMTKLEYVNTTDNANFAQNRVIYTWTDASGGKGVRKTSEIQKFTFKTMQEGTAHIIVTGEFYDKDGNSIEIDDGDIQIQIQETKNEQQDDSSEQENSVSKDNTNLKIMRINEEGISPTFQKDIKDYYFVADGSMDTLDVIAIPENSKSTVTITGNQKLKQGLNTIKIQVQSEDRTKTTTYLIHVTKTETKELANSNLENLAVRDAMLYPPFDANITQYEIEVSNQTDKLDILAIPEMLSSIVTIQGNETLKEGNNTIIIDVMAEDKITHKRYIIKAHRRNEQEEIKEKEEKENEAEQLATILADVNEQQKQEQENREESRQTEAKHLSGKMIVVGAIVILFICLVGYLIYRKTKIN